jgi:hypothetical protein
MPRGENAPQTALRTDAVDSAPARAPLRLSPGTGQRTDGVRRLVS